MDAGGLRIFALVTDWRSRLTAVIETSGRSMRDISLSAGVSQNYLGSILHEGKLCDELGVSVTYLCSVSI